MSMVDLTSTTLSGGSLSEYSPASSTNVAGLILAMMPASALGRATHWPNSRLIGMNQVCKNAPLERPSRSTSITLHWPNTSSSPFEVNEPVRPHRNFMPSSFLNRSLKRAPDGFLSRVSSSNTTPSKPSSDGRVWMVS